MDPIGVAVFGNTRQNQYLSGISALLHRMLKAGLPPYLNRTFGEYLIASGVENVDYLCDSFPADEVSTLVSIGGDGTFLRAAQWVADSGVPMMGINTGHLGFLANWQIDDDDAIIGMLSANTRCLERRMLLKISCPGIPPGFWPYALNEVALLKSDSASMVTVSTRIDGEYLADYQADGLIISTPTGSTAYNLSVGGPILEPTVSNIVLSPIATHSLTMRPLVIGGNSEIEVTVNCAARNYRISLDGRTFTLPCRPDNRDAGTPLRITSAPFTINVLQRPGYGFSDILRNKLLWGAGGVKK